MLIRRGLLALSLIAAAASPAAARWHEAKTRHFIIYSEQKPNDLADYAERLERFDSMVRQIRTMEDPELTDGARVTIYVLPSVSALQSLYGRSERKNVLGFYIPRAAGSVAFVSNRTEERNNGLSAEHIFQHEYLHHMMLSDTKTPLAPWMIEGFAEFFGTAEVQKDGSIKIGLPPQSRSYSILNDFGFNAEQLLTAATPRNQEDHSSIYGKGWLLAHFLSFSEARRGQLETYVRGLARGQKPLAAAQAAFGDLKQLDQELDRYARGSFRGAIVSPGPKPAVALRPLSAGEEAIMPIRIRSERGVNASTARSVAADAARIAAPYPNEATVQAVLAEALFDARDYAGAKAAADRAIAANPKHPQALLYRAKAMIAEARGAPAKADWSAIRQWLVRANGADLENAEPLYLFYQTFRMAGVRPTANAIDGLYYSFALAPNDIGLRMTTVRQLLIDKKVEAAEPVLAAVIFNPHLNIAKRPKLTEAMERIKARDTSGALAAIEADYLTRSGTDDDGIQGIARPSTLPDGE